MSALSRTITPALVGSAVLALAACSSPRIGPLSLSITEMGSEMQEDAGSLFHGIRHRRAHNVTGLAPTDTVGQISLDPDPPLVFRWPTLFSRTHLPDQLAPRLSPTCSKVVVRDLPMRPGTARRTDDAADLDAVLALRDALSRFAAAELPLREAQVQAVLAQRIVALESAAAQPPAEAASAAGGATPTTPRRQADQAQLEVLLRAWQRFAAGLPAPTDLDGWKAQAQEAARRAAAANQSAQDARNAVNRARSQPGLVVARWSYTSDEQRRLGLAGIAASSQQASQRTGFVVLGHPRTVTLMVGSDLIAGACSAASSTGSCEPESQLSKPGSQYTTTYQLLAEHVAWDESGSEERLAAFAVQVDELIKGLAAVDTGSLGGIVGALKITLEGAAQSMASAENTGALSGAEQREFAFSFGSRADHDASLRFQRELNGAYSVVASMRTTLRQLVARRGGDAPEHATQSDCHAPTDPGEIQALSTVLGCGLAGADSGSLSRQACRIVARYGSPTVASSVPLQPTRVGSTGR